MCFRVCHFMDIKPIDTHGLKECVPQPWWESEEPVEEKSIESQTRKQRYLADCENIKKKTLGNILTFLNTKPIFVDC